MTVMSPAPAPEIDALLDELSRTLWKQRGLIEELQYRLAVQQLVMTASNERHLQRALEEVEAAMEDLRRSERSRDLVVRKCAEAFGRDDDVSLAELRTLTNDVWAATLADHQDALLGLVAETERLAGTNRELAQRGAADARALMDAVTGTTHSNAYGPANTGRGLARPALVDRTA